MSSSDALSTQCRRGRVLPAKTAAAAAAVPAADLDGAADATAAADADAGAAAAEDDDSEEPEAEAAGAAAGRAAAALSLPVSPSAPTWDCCSCRGETSEADSGREGVRRRGFMSVSMRSLRASSSGNGT